MEQIGVVISIIIICILCVLLCVSIIFNVRHAKIILNMQDALEEALDVCDQSYARITDIMELPVATVTPEVKIVVERIAEVRNSVLYVSNVLAAPYGGIVEENVDVQE